MVNLRGPRGTGKGGIERLNGKGNGDGHLAKTIPPLGQARYHWMQ